MNDILFYVLVVCYLLFVSWFVARKNQVLQYSFGLFFASIILPSIFSYDDMWKLAGFAVVVAAAIIEDKLIRSKQQMDTSESNEASDKHTD